MLRTTNKISAIGLSLGVVFTTCSCDPQKDALKLFQQQGLTVLEPARDYIALGGIFVVPSSGNPVYLDPYDTLPGTGGGANPFRAIIQQQSSDKSFGLKAAVGTLGGLVPIPAGLNFSDSTQVQLAQVDASGTRYTSQMVTALVAKPSTGQAIKDQLEDAQHNKTSNRVFIIQEIYTGKGFSVKSSSGVGLAASIEGSASIPSCSSSSSGTPAAATGAKSGTGTGATAPATGTPTGNAASSGAKGAVPGSGQKTGAATGGSSNSASGGSGTNSGSASNVGISVGACWSSSATLSFQSDTAIPFAVRLNEVVLGPGDNLQVKITGFKVPTKAMGGGNKDVAATALIDDSNVLAAFDHKPH